MQKSTTLFNHRLLKSIADSMCAVFITLIIYKSTNNISMSFLYLVIYYLSVWLGYYIFLNFIKSHGILAIVIELIWECIALFILTQQLNVPLILILGCLKGLGTALYYGALNIMFFTLDKNINVAKFETGYYIGKIIFCIASAYILGEYSNSIIFLAITSSILYACSCLPLLLNKKQLKIEYIQYVKKPNKQIWQNNFKAYITLACINLFSCARNYVIPLYLYIKGLSFSLVGILLACTYIIQIIAGSFASYLDKKNLSKITTIITSCIISISIILIFTLNNMYFLYALTILLNFVYQILYVLYNKKFGIIQNYHNCRYQATPQRDRIVNIPNIVCCGIMFFIPSSIVAIIFSVICCILVIYFGLSTCKQTDNIHLQKAQNNQIKNCD